jgi:hypothetical protein
VPSPLELCEDFIVHLPPSADLNVTRRNGYAFSPAGSPGMLIVQQIRLADSDVTTAVEEVRAIARDSGRTRVAWWAGSLSTPSDLAARLEHAGLVPDSDEPVLASMTMAASVEGPTEPPIEVSRVSAVDEFLTAQEIDLITMGVPEDQRPARLEGSRRFWEKVKRDQIISLWLARFGGRPAAMARAAVGRHGMLLLGGATLEEFRGRGLYRALVHARAAHAARLGLDALVVQAGKHSRPILHRLGFQMLGEIRVYVDEFVDADVRSATSRLGVRRSTA